jgi:hypothetical protein
MVNPQTIRPRDAIEKLVQDVEVEFCKLHARNVVKEPPEGRFDRRFIAGALYLCNDIINISAEEILGADISNFSRPQDNRVFFVVTCLLTRQKYQPTFWHIFDFYPRCNLRRS